MLLAKTTLGTNEVFISKALIDLYVNHDEFVLVNNLLRDIMRWKKKKKSRNFCGIHYINVADISRKNI